MPSAVPFLVLAGVALCAQSPAPSAQEVLARAKAAMGGAAWDRAVTVEYEAALHVSGMDGTMHAFTDLPSGMETVQYDLKTTKGRNGSDTTAAWSQDESGDLKVEDGPEASRDFCSQRYATTRAYWFPNRAPGRVSYQGVQEEAGHTFHVLNLQPEGGDSYQLWVDAADWTFNRTVATAQGKTHTNRFSDYREVAGLKLPFLTVSGSGDPAFDTRIQYTAVRINPPVPKQTYQRPKAALKDFGIAGGAPATTLPLEYLREHIFVQVRLNGKGPYRFFLDTGGANLIPPSLAKELGLTAQGSVQGGGVGEKTEAFGLTKVGRVELGSAWMGDQSFYVIPSFEGIGKMMGLEVAGVVGYELFRRFVARVDTQAGQLTLYRPETFRYQGSGVTVPFTFRGHTPQIQGELDGVPGIFDLDTGSGSTLDVYSPFAAAHQLKEKAARSFHMIIGHGVGGAVWGDVIRARELKLGGLAMAEPIVALAQASTGAYANEAAVGNVGQGFLKRCTLTFDYPHQTITFEKNAAWGDRDRFPMSGLQTEPDHSGRIRLVLPGTPAQEAGVQPEDVLVAVNGRPFPEFNSDELRAIFLKPGAKVELTLRTGAAVRKVNLVLRELL